MTEQFEVKVEHWKDFQFLVDFQQDGSVALLTDEPAPLGEGKGPNPARLLAAAVGNCLAASLLFCLKKAQMEPDLLRAVVRGSMVRNDRGRMRIKELRVQLEPVLAGDDFPRLNRCGDLFQDFCIVTESVREGIDISVQVTPVAADPVPA